CEYVSIDLPHPSHHLVLLYIYFSFFFFNDTATTEIYTLSLHDALPISRRARRAFRRRRTGTCRAHRAGLRGPVLGRLEMPARLAAPRPDASPESRRAGRGYSRWSTLRWGSVRCAAWHS